MGALPSEKLLPVLGRLLAMTPIELCSGKGIEAMQKGLAASKARIEEDAAWPSMKSELERKAIETVHDIVHRFQSENITQAQAASAVAAVMDTTSGLIGFDVFDTLNATLKELRK